MCLTTKPTTSEVKKWPQILVILNVSIVYFTTGLHIGWPSSSIPKLLSNEYPFDVTADEASYITIISFLGNICGSCANVLVDRIGRKRTILLIALPEMISFLMIILSYEVMGLIYVGRFMGGFGEGFSITTLNIYITEIVDPKIRGSLGCVVAVVWYCGILISNVVGSYASIRTAASCYLISPVIFLSTFWKMPESPYYLLMKKRRGEAEKVLRFLKWKNDVSNEVASLERDVNRQMSETGTFKDIFTIDSNRRAFFITIGARFFQVHTGMVAFNLYLQVLLKQASKSLSSEIGSTIILSIQVFMTIISMFFIDRWGRKPLLLFSVSGCFINLIIQSVYFILRDYTTIDLSAIEWFPLLTLILHIILYSLGLGVVTTIMISEMFSAKMKSKLTYLVNISYAVFTMCSTKFYQATADKIGLAVPFVTFSVLSLLGVFFFRIFVPETKGKSLEEIQQQLKGSTV